jgi:antitoxin component YwqK of YwqJK toxin-antitoxin module
MEKKNGVVETYYDNGQPELRANYEDGKLNGLCETWDENGQLVESATYKDGVAVE